MIKFSKIFILFIAFLFIFSPLAFATTQARSFNPGSVEAYPNTPYNSSDSINDTTSIQTTGLQILRLIQVLSTIISVILMPVCLVLGILYIAKSNSNTVKKFIIGFIIILFPYALFIIGNILVFFFTMLSLFS